MFDKIKTFFDTTINNNDQPLSQEKIHLASAALMVEVATIDQKFDDSELVAFKKILVEHYHVDGAELDSVADRAQQQSQNSTSIYQFTQLLNENCDYQDKYKLVRSMWTIAYADGDLDKYEEYIIRKTSELLHLSHSDFIRAKHEVRSTYD